ncbi:MAG: hypothetical protein KDI13_00865 [Alphaproteobacteria bacterium]|nr:hypothetical protein [Alphaproteobacteria bacterium]
MSLKFLSGVRGIQYPLIYGVLPAALFFVLKSFDLLSGLLPTLYGFCYFGLYIPFSLWLINRHFSFKISSLLKSLFWLPYIAFSLMCLTFVLTMGGIALAHYLSGQLPDYMSSGIFVLIALILSILIIFLAIVKSVPLAKQ